MMSPRQASPSPARATMRSGKFTQPNAAIDMLPGPGARMGSYQTVFGHARRVPKALELEWARQDAEQMLVYGAMEATISRQAPSASPKNQIATTPTMDPPLLAPPPVALPTRRPSQYAPTQYSLSFNATGSSFFDDTLNVITSSEQPEKRFEDMVRRLAETDISIDSEDEKPN